MAWLGTWANRYKITISSTNIDATVSNFPVLLYLSTSSGTGSADVSAVFDEIGANSLKIAVTTSDGSTQCYVEIEKWDSVNEKAWLWVKVPSISASTDTDLYLYYDSTHADNTTYVGAVGSTPGKNVWDDDYVLVCHMGDATTSTVKDSTSNAHDGTKKGANEPIQVAGKLGDAQDFDGSNDYISFGDHSAFSFGDGSSDSSFTVEALVYLDSDTNAVMMSKTGALATNNLEWVFYANASKYFQLRLYDETTAAQIAQVATATLGTAAWTLLASTYDGSGVASGISLYKDGSSYASAASTVGSYSAMHNTGANVELGARFRSDATYSAFQNGKQCEVRISKIVRSAAWIKATYHTCFDTLVSYGIYESNIVLEESFSMDDTISAPGNIYAVLEESFSTDDSSSGGFDYDASIEESFSMDDSLSVAVDVILTESLSMDDFLAVATDVIMAESLSMDDDTTPQWVLYQTLAESLSLDDEIDSSTTNTFGRYREPTNLSANRISVKFQNNTLSQSINLIDFGILAYAKYQLRDNNHPMNLQNQHIQVKIQNNTVDETLHLFDFGANLIGRLQR